MRISEIIEGKIIKNTYQLFDILRGNNALAREVRQTYIKLSKNKKLSIEKKRYTLWWATAVKNREDILRNTQLVQMLEEIIRICSE